MSDRGKGSQALRAGLRISLERDATNCECKTGQGRREVGGGWGRAMLTQFMLKIFGGSEATGLWPGARPNHGPRFHMRVSLWHVYSPPLGRVVSGRSGPPGPREGGRQALAVGGGLRAFGWASTVPIRVNYRGRPLT